MICEAFRVGAEIGILTNDQAEESKHTNDKLRLGQNQTHCTLTQEKQKEKEQGEAKGKEEGSRKRNQSGHTTIC